jgi:hypothetical protein
MRADTDGVVRMPPVPARFPKRKRRGKTSVPAPPEHSGRLYVYVAPSKVGLFRYLLEAHDNLGLMTVVDRRRAALLLRFVPGMEKGMREFVESVKAFLPCVGPLVLPRVDPAALSHVRGTAYHTKPICGMMNAPSRCGMMNAPSRARGTAAAGGPCGNVPDGGG